MKLEYFGDPRALPPFGAITPDDIGPALEAAIEAHEQVVAQIITDRPKVFAETWIPLENAESRLDAVWSAVSHLHRVVDTGELRRAHAAGQARVTEYYTSVGQNRALYEVLVTLTKTTEFASLPASDRAAVQRAVRNFTLSGVGLEQDEQERFKAVSIELSQLSTDFGAAVLDATDAWSEHVADEQQLAGLSENDKAMLAAAAAAKGLDGWLISLQMPSVTAILSFAENRELRARVYRAFGTRASDQGPHAGDCDNGPRIRRILQLRHEAAGLLGYADPVDWSLATKMASSTRVVLAFLRNLAARAKPTAAREFDELRAFAKAELGIVDLQPWDAGFAASRLREARYGFDEQALKVYFPIDQVMVGWRKLLGQLFGISLIERNDAPTWHPDARFFDVMDDDGALIAGLYLDLFARTGKQGGAWMDQARPRLSDGTVPVAHLVCNFAPPGEGSPSLLGHNDVVTLLHETGHSLHHLFTKVDRPSIAGTRGFEWDAIELPSQLMEDFGWDKDVLTGMSGHCETGAPLPAALFDQLSAARHFQAGMSIVRHIEYSLFDLLLHLGTMGSDPIEVLEAVRDEVAVIRPPAWHRFPHAFSHIFAGSYASGYYSYLWAEVLAADGFQAFLENGLLDRPTGDLLRLEILSKGATRPAAESFRAFRGRDPDPQAILLRHGLARR